MTFRPGNHLWALAFILGIFGLLKERDLSLAVENRNGIRPAVPADEIEINHLVRDAAAIEILPDSVWEILVELSGKLHEIEILVCHVASVAAGWKHHKEGKVAGIYE